MAKRIAVSVVGGVLLLGGLVLMVLPGPGILLVVAGLAVLASEFAWAHRLLRRARVRAHQAQAAAVSSPLRTAASVLAALSGVALGVAVLVVDDVRWPYQDALLDRLWSPLTGWVLIGTGLILLTTTLLAVRAGHRRASLLAEAEARAQARPDVRVAARPLP